MSERYARIEEIGPRENGRGSIHGLMCDVCGAQVPDFPRATKLHDQWHAAIAQNLDRLPGTLRQNRDEPMGSEWRYR